MLPLNLRPANRLCSPVRLFACSPGAADHPYSAMTRRLNRGHQIGRLASSRQGPAGGARHRLPIKHPAPARLRLLHGMQTCHTQRCDDQVTAGVVRVVRRSHFEGKRLQGRPGRFLLVACLPGGPVFDAQFQDRVVGWRIGSRHPVEIKRLFEHGGIEFIDRQRRHAEPEDLLEYRIVEQESPNSPPNSPDRNVA